MIYDPNLNPVLEKADNEDLQYLVDIITKAMTNSLEGNEFYKAHAPDHKKYANLIAQEIRSFGGNTFVNVFRGGQGPEYKTVVYDVVKQLKIPCRKTSDIATLENLLLEHIFELALEKLNDDEKKELLAAIGTYNSKSFNGQALTVILLRLFAAGGFASYQISVIIANSVVKSLIGRGLSLGANATLTKTLSILAGPVGWIITGLWTAVDIAGPAYRVTIPSVIYVAMLRKKYYTPICPHCKQMISAGVKFCPECGKEIQTSEQ